MRRDLSRLAFAAVALAAIATPGRAAIYGTMSNFDVFNDTPFDVFGCELELEGVHSADVYNTFPSHFDHRTVTEYNDGTTFGTRINFTGYNFSPTGYLSPTVGQSTNGHACVDTAGCEHFGFAVSAQPTATRYFWTDAAGQRIGNLPMAVPTPSWNYIPPVGNGNAGMRAEVELPEAENHIQRPDAIWMKVFKTELNRPVKLRELMSGDDIVPEDEAETETEWELLERGMVGAAEDKVRDQDKAVIRRYEFFKYTGTYDDEHEAISLFDSDVMAEPPVGELGDFISANMVAANLAPQVIVEGDYNDDGVVDAGDYIMWRHHLGSEVQVEMDGDHSNLVDDGDFDVWRRHYGGQQGGAEAVGNNAVPEPTGMLLLLSSVGWALRYRGRRIA